MKISYLFTLIFCILLIHTALYFLNIQSVFWLSLSFYQGNCHRIFSSFTYFFSFYNPHTLLSLLQGWKEEKNNSDGDPSSDPSLFYIKNDASPNSTQISPISTKISSVSTVTTPAATTKHPISTKNPPISTTISRTKKPLQTIFQSLSSPPKTPIHPASQALMRQLRNGRYVLTELLVRRHTKLDSGYYHNVPPHHEMMSYHPPYLLEEEGANREPTNGLLIANTQISCKLNSEGGLIVKDEGGSEYLACVLVPFDDSLEDNKQVELWSRGRDSSQKLELTALVKESYAQCVDHSMFPGGGECVCDARNKDAKEFLDFNVGASGSLVLRWKNLEIKEPEEEGGERDVFGDDGFSTEIPSNHLSFFSQRRRDYTQLLAVGRGSYGEVWRAIALCKECHIRDVVLKFIFSETEGDEAYLSAMREIAYGDILANETHVSRFIESFEEKKIAEFSEMNKRKELWLAFAYEGITLHSYIFAPSSEMSGVVSQSEAWWKLKKSGKMSKWLKDIAFQLLLGVKAAHSRHITHRDIKMQNIFISEKPDGSHHLRLGDWGSAVTLNFEDADLAKTSNFDYLRFRPSQNEETEGFQPPETLVGGEIFNFWRKPSYDMWCVGLVLLQLILGIQQPLTVQNQRVRAALERKFYAEPEVQLRNALFLQSLADVCLFPGGPREVGGSYRRCEKITNDCDAVFCARIAKKKKKNGFFQTQKTSSFPEETQIEAITNLMQVYAANLGGSSSQEIAAFHPLSLESDLQKQLIVKQPAYHLFGKQSCDWIDFYQMFENEHICQYVQENQPDIRWRHHHSNYVPSLSSVSHTPAGVWHPNGALTPKRARSEALTDYCKSSGALQKPEKNNSIMLSSEPAVTESSLRSYNRRVFPEKIHRAQHEEEENSEDIDDEDFRHILILRDISGVGLPDKLFRSLLKMLLAFYPDDRITVDEALQHPLFAET